MPPFSAALEKARKPGVALDHSLEDFVRAMAALKLPYPKKMDFAVPGNQQRGQCPPNVPAEFQAQCA